MSVGTLATAKTSKELAKAWASAKTAAAKFTKMKLKAPNEKLLGAEMDKSKKPAVFQIHGDGSVAKGFKMKVTVTVGSTVNTLGVSQYTPEEIKADTLEKSLKACGLT